MKAAAKTDWVYFSNDGQVTIPRHLCKQFGIEAGTRASVTSTPEGILIRPVNPKFIRSLRGSLKGTGVMKIFMEFRKQEREL